MCNITDPVDDDALAIHEAGHLIVAVVLDRHIEKVSLDCIAGIRGCFYEAVDEADWDDYREMLCVLAGPRAQIELRSDSITEAQRQLFQQKITQVQQSLWEIPPVYDYTGWGPDMNHVYTYLAMPHAPAFGFPFGVTHKQVVDNAEGKLKHFFDDPNRAAQCRVVANALLAARLMPGVEAEALVAATLSIDDSAALLAW